MDFMHLGYKADAFLKHITYHIPSRVQQLKQDSFSNALAILFLFRAKPVPEAFGRMLNVPSGDDHDMVKAGQFVALACRPFL
jgi:hypothetical protein